MSQKEEFLAALEWRVERATPTTSQWSPLGASQHGWFQEAVAAGNVLLAAGWAADVAAQFRSETGEGRVADLLLEERAWQVAALIDLLT